MRKRIPISAQNPHKVGNNFERRAYEAEGNHQAAQLELARSTLTELGAGDEVNRLDTLLASLP